MRTPLLPVLALAFALSTPVAQAQITNVTNSTSTPTPGSGHDYINMLNETVNPANGSVSIRLGAPVPPSRGFSLPFSFQYDSNGALVLRGSLQGGSAHFYSNTTFLSQGGWSYGVPLLSANYFFKTVQLPNGNTIQCRTDKDFVFQDPSGGRHALRLAGSQHVEITQCPNTPFLSGGDDFVLATMFNCYLNCPVKVSNNDGTVFSFDGAFDNVAGFTQSGASLPTSIEDRNGNKILVTTSSGTTTFTDTAGRSAVSFAAFGTDGSTVSVSGLSSPYTVHWGSASLNFGVNPVQVAPDSSCSPISNASGSMPVISSIIMPNGKSYQLIYDSTYGLLNQITYPSGGWIKYSWGLNPKSEVGFYADSQGHANSCEYNYDWPAIQHRYVSFDGTNIALQQDFSYAISWAAGNLTWTSKQTVVTTHDCARNNFNCTGAPTELPPGSARGIIRHSKLLT